MENNLMPSLRFPIYKQDKWLNYRLDELVKKKISYGIVQAGKHVPDGMPYIKSQDLNSELKVEALQRTSKEIAKKYERSEVKPGDIVFSLRGNIGLTKIVPESIKVANLTQGTARLSIDNNNSNVFVHFALQNRKCLKRIIAVSKGSTFQEISLFDLRKVKLNLPSLPEQTKIANFLTAVDKRINLLQKKKTELEQYKKGIMQKLISQAIRFKDDDGNDFPDWEKKKLAEVLFEHKLKNKGNKFNEVFSVSKEKGVINQIEHLGRSYSADSIEHYKLIEPNDITYTKSPTSDFPYGIIKQNQTGRTGVLSPLYGVFRPQTPWLGTIIHEYFLSWVNTFNYLNPIVHKGAKNTLNINNDVFLNGAKLLLPIDIREQKKIANFFLSIDKSINKLGNQIEESKLFKQGLLQKMFV